MVRNLEAESATCHLLPLTTGATIFLVIATGFPHTDVDELERSVVREIEGIGDLTEEEAARAIIGSETSTLRELQRVETRADLLSMYATHFGDAGRLKRDLRRLRSVTVQEAREWGRSYLHNGNRASVRYIPEESS